MKYRYIFVFSVIAGVVGLVLYFHFGKVQKKEVEIQAVVADNFDLEKAPSESLRGEITSMSGMVEWMSRTAKEAVRLDGAREIQQGEGINTQKDGSAVIQFSDACLITIFANSEINFIQTLPENIVIELKRGSADYVERGKMPVSVRALDLLVEVNGEAKVVVDRDKQIVEVLVEQGSATAAYNDLEFVSNTLKINEGSSFVFDNDSREGELE